MDYYTFCDRHWIPISIDRAYAKPIMMCATICRTAIGKSFDQVFIFFDETVQRLMITSDIGMICFLFLNFLPSLMNKDEIIIKISYFFYHNGLIDNELLN